MLLNCIICFIADRKREKVADFLHPVPKKDIPLGIYHIDFLRPLPSTNGNYQHVFRADDALCKFIWLYLKHKTSTADALEKLT